MSGPSRLQDYLDSVGLQRPISTRNLEAGSRLRRRLLRHSSRCSGAVKKAKREMSERDLERFKQEFAVMKRLNFPYVV